MQQQQQRSMVGPFLLVMMAIFSLLALAVFVGQFLSAQGPVPAPNQNIAANQFVVDGILVDNANHADLVHGDEAAQVRNACQSNGHYQIWMEPDHKTFHRLCQLPDGRWGDWIVAVRGALKEERTAFIPKDGSWGAVIKWLIGKGAARFTGQW